MCLSTKLLLLTSQLFNFPLKEFGFHFLNVRSLISFKSKCLPILPFEFISHQYEYWALLQVKEQLLLFILSLQSHVLHAYVHLRVLISIFVRWIWLNQVLFLPHELDFKVHWVHVHEMAKVLLIQDLGFFFYKTQNLPFRFEFECRVLLKV